MGITRQYVIETPMEQILSFYWQLAEEQWFKDECEYYWIESGYNSLDTQKVIKRIKAEGAR